MAKSIFAKTSFTLGELSPRVLGRFEETKPIYRDGAAFLENWMIFQYGGIFFRPGSQYVYTAKQTDPVRLQSFKYSTLQAYILEMGNQYMRFYANKGIVVSGSTPVEITTPYSQANLWSLQFANKYDVMYIANANYPVYKLVRTSATSFSISKVQFIGGPFMDTNVSNATITASSDTGATTLTATIPAWLTGTLYIASDWVTNGGQTYQCIGSNLSGTFATDLAAGLWVVDTFFKAGHVGALWRVKSGVVVLSTFTSATVMVGNVQATAAGVAGNLGTSGAATDDWAEGSFSSVRGYPSTLCFHEDRLVLGATTAQPKTFWGSVVGAYEDFEVGSAGDSDAYSFTASLGDAFRWMKSTTSGLQIGTAGGTITAADGTTAGITPKSPPNITLGVDYSVAYMESETISSYLYFLQSNTYQLRQLVYDYTIAANKAEDMMLLSDHILRDGSGAVQMSRQQSPNDRIWMPRSDGQLAVLTRNVEQQVFGWCRLVSGLSSGGPGLYKSCAIIPTDGGDDQVWVSVQRSIGGTVKQFVEVFTSELFTNYWEPNRLDASLTFDNPVTITGISQHDPCVVTAPSHGFTDGDKIKIDNVVGMTDVNQSFYIIANVTTHTFSLQDENGNDIDSTDYDKYWSGGQARKMEDTFSGLDHLEGETVSVTADGGLPAAQQTFVVSGGSITLPNPAAVVHVGLPYTGTVRFLPFGESGGGVTTQTEKRKVYKPVFRMWQSIGGKFGDRLDNLFPVIYPNQTPNVVPGHFAGLYTGDVELSMESAFSDYFSPYLVQDVPLPMMMLAAVFRSDIQSSK